MNLPDADPGPVNQYYDQILRMVKTYVTDHLKTATLEEAAVLSHLSAGYLSRLFKSSVPCPFQIMC